jgi:hypothetical protein
MLDFLRIHVVYAPGSKSGAEAAELISSHFDGLGMDREGVAVRVPVRFHSAPWEDSGAPRAIDLSRATHNAVVLLHDNFVHAKRDMWGKYISTLRGSIQTRGGIDVYIPFGSPTGEAPLPGDAAIQYARRDLWRANLKTDDAKRQRLLLHLVFQLRDHVRAWTGGAASDEPLFVSHAKVDGDETAKAIVNFVNATDQDVPLRTFYDAKELSPGDDFKGEFEATIEKGTLLAIVSDAYDTRPWCVYELTTAKRARRPIVLADVGLIRTNRTYPYGANLPKVRLSPEKDSTEWIEPLLVQTLSEGLRCDLFLAQVRSAVRGKGLDEALLLPRPPELFDLVDSAVFPSAIVYPDPPLALIEEALLRKCMALASKSARLITLSELA